MVDITHPGTKFLRENGRTLRWWAEGGNPLKKKFSYGVVVHVFNGRSRHPEVVEAMKLDTELWSKIPKYIKTYLEANGGKAE